MARFRSHRTRLATRCFVRRRAFSLIEMVMVITIIGMISSMAVPRISRGASGAADAAMLGDLAVIRRAINFYAAEHNGTFPGATAAKFANQLTQYTDAQGNLSANRTSVFPLGPYLMRIPPAPVGENAGNSQVLIDASNSPPKARPSSGDGWVYNPNTGEFYANTGVRQQAGVTLDVDPGALGVGAEAALAPVGAGND